MNEQRAKVGEIRQWLKPREYEGEFHRFMVIDVKRHDRTGENWCNIKYPNGHIQRIRMSDLFRDPEDPEDDEYSVCIEEVVDEAQDGADKDRILQG